MSEVTPTERPAHGPVNDAGDGQVIPERKAKQGRRGVHMFAVLAISTILAAVVMFGLWGLHAGKLNDAAQARGESKAAAAKASIPGRPSPSRGRTRPNAPISAPDRRIGATSNVSASPSLRNTLATFRSYG